MAKSVMRGELRVGEAVRVDGDRIVIALEHKSGRSARLRIEVDNGIQVDWPKDRKAAPYAAQGVRAK